MRFALEVWGADLPTLVDTCRQAESLGFDAFYYGESPNGLNLDCWTVLTVLAQETDRIELGPVIANILPTYRSTVLLARQVATVAIVADGRLAFRTGAGAARHFGRDWWVPYGVDYPSYEARRADADHALGLLRPLWAGEAVPLGPIEEGPVRLGFDCPPILITVSATGPRGMALAATYGDVWESSFRTPAEFEELAEQFHRIAALLPSDDQRPPPVRSLEIDAAVGTDAVAAAARLATFRRDRAGEDVDALLPRALIGTPQRVAEQIEALAAAGVDQLVIALHDPHDHDALEALAWARRLVES
ncbi:MAG: LLM class flavin-dependent oxidoreductase [Actinomycetota bacterium]